MAKKYFTVAEANAMIPELKYRLPKLKQLRTQMQIISQYLMEAGCIADEETLELITEELSVDVIDEVTSLKLLVDEMNKQITELIGFGVLVKDVDRGLVDWYAKKGDRDIFLCWQLGERSVTHWHETDTGFKGRKRIEKL